MDTAITIHIVRHAPTIGNEKRQYIGWTDEPIVRAQDIEMVDHRNMHVIGSDLVRCQQTASCYFPNATFHGIAAFREMHFGDFERQTYEDLKHSKLYRDWINQPFDIQPPNGESFQTFEQRVWHCFRAMDIKNGQWFVLHGGVIRLLLMHVAPEEKAFWDWQVPHHTVFSLTWENGELLKEGKRCTFLSVEPITAKSTMSNNG